MKRLIQMGDKMLTVGATLLVSMALLMFVGVNTAGAFGFAALICIYLFDA